MTLRVSSGTGIATGPDTLRRPGGGGILAVILDPSIADLVLDRIGALARPGPAPLTVLAQVRRPLVPVAFPSGPVGPCWTDDFLVAEAREALSGPIGTLGQDGGVDVEFAFCALEKAAVRLLRERDYAQVVIGSRSSMRQRRQCRRVASAASSYCTVDVVQMQVRD
jgi:hypothetical protein